MSELPAAEWVNQCLQGKLFILFTVAKTLLIPKCIEGKQVMKNHSHEIHVHQSRTIAAIWLVEMSVSTFISNNQMAKKILNTPMVLFIIFSNYSSSSSMSHVVHRNSHLFQAVSRYHSQQLEVDHKFWESIVLFQSTEANKLEKRGFHTTAKIGGFHFNFSNLTCPVCK